ncbi:MAG: alkaline phosphatase family protein, partial [Chloroflexota bacterium]
KAILVLSDALRYDVAKDNMGFLSHLVEKKLASLYKITDDQFLIQHGRFYTRDEYPDIELINTAASLIRRLGPDYLLLHPMGMDYHGEKYGSDSAGYRNHAIDQDSMLAPFIMEWRERGYVILVTGDHGINKDGAHGGTTPEQREVPLFVIQPEGGGRGDTGQTISQLQIAPTILNVLQIPLPQSMKKPPLDFS